LLIDHAVAVADVVDIEDAGRRDTKSEIGERLTELLRPPTFLDSDLGEADVLLGDLATEPPRGSVVDLKKARLDSSLGEGEGEVIRVAESATFISAMAASAASAIILQIQ
jgi:hypothetical protein